MPGRWLHPIVSLALPPRCPGCGIAVAADDRFCADCWGRLRFLGPPWCAGCSLPFAFDRGPGALCGDCLAEPRHDRGVRAAVAYGEIARRLALRLKYGGRPGLARTMAAAMARLVPGGADLLVPVPLHRWRLWARGYNQAALIARALGRITGAPLAVDLLRRTKATPVLRGLGPVERRRTVRGAFVVAPGGAALLKGRTVLLVDDVYTTGATADACARALKRAGAAEVRLLCWARVVRSED